MAEVSSTKDIIVQSSAELFNLQGYKATSLTDIEQKTGLTKGAIYRHFKNKEELECAALMYMCNNMMSTVRGLVKAERTSVQKLEVVADYFSTYAIKPPFEGGCPLMNAGTEADDSHPGLKKIVSKVMVTLHASVISIVKNGQKHDQLRKDLSSEGFASLFVSSLEGAIVLMNVTGNKQHLRDVAAFLKKEIQRQSNSNKIPNGTK